MLVEAKFRPTKTVRNVGHLIMASNASWVVPAGLDERCFFVLDVSDARAQDTDYFGALKNQLNCGGREAMLHDLMTIDLSDFEVRKVPQTKALAEQKIHSFGPVESWWFERLQEGRLLDYQKDWESGVETPELHSAHAQAATVAGERHRGSETQLSSASACAGRCPAVGQSQSGPTVETDESAFGFSRY